MVDGSKTNLRVIQHTLPQLWSTKIVQNKLSPVKRSTIWEGLIIYSTVASQETKQS